MKNAPDHTAPKRHQADLLLTVKKIAEIDDCSEKTVRRAIDAGVLEAIRIGPAKRAIRVHPDAHAAYRRRVRL